MKVTALLSIAALSIAGCAQSSGALTVGPDTYMISVQAAPARGGAGGAQAMGLKDAAAHCQTLGKQLLVINTARETVNVYGAGNSNITFRCLSPDDSELVRPTYNREPSVVIENRSP